MTPIPLEREITRLNLLMHGIPFAIFVLKTPNIELKGCLDGNNTNIFQRPANANEFLIWSVCTNPGADPRHNAWSGIHTRLSAEIITRHEQIDGCIVWDIRNVKELREAGWGVRIVWECQLKELGFFQSLKRFLGPARERKSVVSKGT